MPIIINIADDYTKTPGGRCRIGGDFSGEDFMETWLEPKYIEAKNAGEKLIVNFDGSYGYPSSFLEEAFGGLARKLKDNNILSIEFISDEEPSLIEKVKDYLKKALK